MAPNPQKPKKNAVSIRLNESAIFLRTDGPSARRTNNETRNSMLRGLLVLDLVKPTKITSIDVQLTATTSTAWPEGIGARRVEVTEEHRVFHASTTYFRAGKVPASTRRTASIGPGVSYSHSLQHSLDGDYGDGEEDEGLDRSWDDLHESRRPHREGDIQDAPRSRSVSRQNSLAHQSNEPVHPVHRVPRHRHVQHDTLACLHLESTSSTAHPRPNRRVSMDPGQLQRAAYESSPGELAAIPPYSPLPPTSELEIYAGSLVTTPQLESPGLNSSVPNSAAHDLEEFRNSLHNSLRDSRPPHNRSSSILSSHSLRQQDRSLSRRPSFSDIIPEDETASPSPHRTRNSSPVPSTNALRSQSSRSAVHSPTAPIPSRSQTHSPSLSRSATAENHASSPTTSQQRQLTPSTERGRKGSRFSLTAVSNIFMDAVRSGSPRASSKFGRSSERDRSTAEGERFVEPSPARSSRRGRTMERTIAVEPTPMPMPVDREGEDEGPREVKESKVSAVLALLLKDKDKEKEKGDNWKEFKSGTYTYPISFSIPSNAPPSLQADFGTVTWRLKASIHRPGTFKSKMTTIRDVTVISCPTEDDTEESENIIVERHWDQQLQYLIAVSGKAFYIGGTVPVTFTLMPLMKVKLYRISVFIEERVDYYTHMRRIARTDPITRIPLLSIKHEGKNPEPILPLESEDVEVLRNSPLMQIVNPEDDLDEMASSLMGPGPWTFHRDLNLPASCDQMKFTNRNRRGNIVITHTLKLVMRVERGDDLHMDKSGKRKLFDIVVQTPVLILSCRCNPEWTALPRYSEVFQDPAAAISPSCPCQVARQQSEHPSGIRGALERITTRHSSDSVASAAETSPVHPTMRSLRQGDYSDSILRSNTLFERLMSGQESEAGEAPPAYDDPASAARSRPPPVSNGVAAL